MLAHRAHFISDEAFLELINDRARSYYTNPLQTLSNHEAVERFWLDPRAQRVPYGRGLFYFIDLNAKALARSGGARSLDDLVLAVLNRQRAGEQVGETEWVDLVTAELGEQGRTDFEALVAGEWIIPAPDALGPRFTRHMIEDYPLDYGFDTSSIPTRVVTGLVAGSVAEQAGVREGDRILSIPNFSDVERAPWEEIDMTLGRGDATLRVHYLPQGGRVRSYAWTSVLEDRA
jgi:predicted metalloprotease with PDZ domain